MKTIVPIIILSFLLTIGTVFAQSTYYISQSAGDDGNDGLSTGTPWKTINRVNTGLSLASPGDVILFSRGDVFPGQIELTLNATAAEPIRIGAYGDSGLTKPVITGTAEVKSWISIGTGLWQANCDECGDQLNQLFINGVSQQIGRYPNLDNGNMGYMTISAFEGDSAIIDDEIPTGVNWTGGTVVTRTERWVLDRSEITNHVNDRIEFYDTRPYRVLKNGIGFFFQNHISTLDLDGEWSFDKQSKKAALYSTIDPNTLFIEVSVHDTLLYGDKDHYVIEDLIIKGGNSLSVLIRNCKNITIKNCDIIDGGLDGVLMRNTDFIHFENNRVAYNNNNGFKMTNCDSSVIEYNVAEFNGTRRGMGGSKGGQHAGLNILGVGNLCQYNSVTNTGMAGIRMSGPGAVIYRNFVQYACKILDDNGGIYTWGANYENREIIENIVLNSIGDLYGTRTTISDAKGIYIDHHSSYVTVKNNTIAFCDGPGLNMNTANHITAVYNNIFACQKNLRMSEHIAEIDYPLGDNYVTHNVAVAVEKNQFTAYFKTIHEGFDHFGIVDSNYYLKPVRTEAMIGISSNEDIYPAYKRDDDARGMGQWLSRTKHDDHTSTGIIKLDEYTINSSIGSDLVQNGDFNNGSTSWISSSKLTVSVTDAGPLLLEDACMVITENTGLPSSAGYLGQTIGAIDTLNAYLLKFSMISDVDNEVLEFVLRDKVSGDDISDYIYFELSASRVEKEYLVVPTKPSTEGQIRFYIENEDGTVAIDNVEFQEVDATIYDPYSNFLFDYNYSNQVKTVVLDEPMLDVRGNLYETSVQIAPYRSVILYKASLEPDTTIYLFTEDGTICAGDAYTWRGNAYDIEGVYYDSIQTISGLGSIYQLNLSVHQAPSPFSIDGKDTVIQDVSVIYSVPDNTEVTYTWDVQQGTISNQVSNDSVEIQWGDPGTGFIRVWAENSYGCISDTALLPVIIGTTGLNVPRINNDVSIYPNPVSDILHVNCETEFVMEIYDMAGNRIIVSNNAQTSVSGLSSGNYIVSIKDQNGSVMRLEKLIFQ